MEPFADLAFAETHRWRPFDVVDPHQATVRSTPAGARLLAPYAAVEVELAAPGGVVSLGLSGVRAAYDGGRGRAWIEVDDGRGPRRLRRRRVRVAPGSTLGFALNENQATLLARPPGGCWKPLLTERDPVRAVLDLRDPAVLATQCWHWKGEGIGEVRTGPFGMAGLRDPHLVQHADGTPYVRDGRHFLTWTCAGLGGFRQAHWGVFALDPADPSSLEQVAHLYVRRGGRVHGDHAGQLVRDGDRWVVAVSTWGDFSPERGVRVRHTTSTADLLSGEHLLDTEPAPLPPGWDPCLQRDGSGWLVGYVASTSLKPFRFHPALARTTADDPWTGLEPVGAATHLDQSEGPVLVRRDGRTWLVASDQRGRSFPVFGTDDLAQHGALSAAYPTNIPHPQLLRRDDGTWLMLTFDGTRWEKRRRETGRRPVLGYGTHGDVVVMQAGPGTGVDA